LGTFVVLDQALGAVLGLVAAVLVVLGLARLADEQDAGVTEAAHLAER